MTTTTTTTTTTTAEENFIAFKQSSLREGIEVEQKYPRNYIHENTEYFYNQFCVNNLQLLEPGLSVELLRLLNGLSECPNIPIKSDNNLPCIDINQLRNSIRSKFKLNISEAEDFSISTVNNYNRHYFGYLYLDRLTAFNVYLGPREMPFFDRESSKELTDQEKALFEEYKCFVCFEIMNEPTTLPCGHSACFGCLKKAFETSRKCSVCNRKFSHSVVEALAVSIHLRSAISHLFPHLEIERDAEKAQYSQLLTPQVELLKQALVDPAEGSRQKWKTLDEQSAAAAVVSGSNLLLLLADEQEETLHKIILSAISNDACKNILRRAGSLGEASVEVYDEIRGITRGFLMDVLRDVIVIATNRGAAIVTVDAVIASKPMNYTVLGYGGDYGIRHVWSSLVTKTMALIHPNLHIDPQALSVYNDICTFIMMKLMERAIRLANESTATATHVKTLTSNDPSFPYDLKFYGTVEGDARRMEEPLDAPVSYVRPGDIEAASRCLLTGQLIEHAGREGTEAVTKFSSDTVALANASMAMASGMSVYMVNDRRVVALVVSRVFKGYPISEDAAVYLAAVMEYLLAEVCELSGNQALEQNCGAVSGRHVMLGIGSDEELDNLFKMCIIRDCGILPHVHKFLVGSVEPSGSSAFEKLLKAKSAGRSFIDPRTGSHCNFDETNTGILRPAPILDMMCKESVVERIALARQALSADELDLMKSEGSFLCSDAQMDGSEAAAAAGNGWAEPSLAKLRFRNLLDIYSMQKSHHKVCNCYYFGCLVEAIAKDLPSNHRFTAEAMECIHTITEGYLIDILECSVLNAVHSGRTLLEPKDLRLTRRILKDFS